MKINVFPEILAGYEAAKEILADTNVVIKDPTRLTEIPTDPMAMMASGPAAYSVELVVLREGVNVIRNGRYGFDEDMTFVRYPCGHESPEFRERFAAELRPVAARELSAARQERADAIKAHGGRGIEAKDAVRRIS